MFKNWNDRDWIWTVSILVIIIIFIISKRLVIIDEGNILNYISFAATGVSIALALVAIGISISQNTSSQQLNTEMHSTIERMDEKLNGMKDNINRIHTMDSYSKKIDDKTDDVSKTYGITSLHGIISTSKPWNGKELVKLLNKNLKRIDKECKIIDYNIRPIKAKIEDLSFEYNTNILLIFNQTLDDSFLDTIISDSFSEIGINAKSSTTYFNNGI